MATNIEEVLGRSINSVKELKDEIKRLQDSIAGVNPESEQFKDTVTKLTAAQEQLSSVTKRNAADTNAASDSIVGMEQKYRSLYNTYKMLTEEQRNSSMGKEMAKDLAKVHNELNATKTAVGNYKDNIGNYAASIQNAFTKMGVSIGGLGGPLKAATTGVLGFNQALKANPIGAVIAAIMGLISIFKNLKGSIQSNEESSMRLKQAMATFQPIVDAVKNTFSALGSVLVSIIEGIAKFVDGIRMAGARIKDFIKGNKDATTALKQQQETYQDLAKSQNVLTKNRREWQKLNAADKATVERLREEAMATGDAAEKARLLNEAKTAQQAINERNIEQAEEELRLLEVEASLTANDAAMNDRLAAAQAKVNEARAQGAQAIRAIERAYQSANNAASGGTGKSRRQQELEEAKKIQQELEQSQKTELQKVEEKYNKELALLKKFNMDTALLTKQYNKDVAEIARNTADTQAQITDRLFKERQSLLSRYEEEEGKFIASLPPDEAWEKMDERLKKKMDASKAAISALFKMEELMSNETNSNYAKIIEGFSKFGLDGIEQWQKRLEMLRKDLIEGGYGIDELPEFNKEKQTESLDNLRQWFKTAALIVKNGEKEVQDEYAAQGRAWLDIFVHNLTETENSYYKKRYELLHSANLEEGKMLAQDAAHNYEMVYKNVLLWADALADEFLSPENRLEAEKNYVAALEELRGIQFDVERYYAEMTSKLWQDSFSSLGTVTQSVQTLTNAIQSQIQAEVQEGKLSESQAKKKTKQLKNLEKVALAANLMGIAGSTASGIMGIWEAYGKEKVANAETAAAAGPMAAATLASLNSKSLASAIINTTAMATQGAANMAAAISGTITRLNGFSSEGSSSTSVVPNIANIDSTAYSMGNTQQDVEREDVVNERPIWVSVVDIESQLNSRKVRVAETTF